jgi:prepilin-type N-terminal cleavage/methylation domain-containing protein
MKERGFSVIELMIAIAISFVVVLGMERVFVSSFRANSTAIAYTNLNSQLRSVMQAMSRDIRRSGFWAGSMGDIANGSQANPFVAVAVVDQDADGIDDCILYGYDSDEDGDPADTNEWRGFRYNAGTQAVEVKVGGGTQAQVTGADCAAGTWESFIDNNVVQVTALVLTSTEHVIQVKDECPDLAEELNIRVRELDVRLTGQLASDNAITRTLFDTVRLRNDQLTVDVIAGGCT